jgi:hypothetical protein
MVLSSITIPKTVSISDLVFVVVVENYISDLVG